MLSRALSLWVKVSTHRDFPMTHQAPERHSEPLELLKLQHLSRYHQGRLDALGEVLEWLESSSEQGGEGREEVGVVLHRLEDALAEAGGEMTLLSHQIDVLIGIAER
jgi:hypothetical protein